MVKVGVCLSGCGVYDGAEIHESVLTLLYLDKANVDIVCMAPSIEQTKVVNHFTNEEKKEKRNVLEEAARIARGNISDIKDIKAENIDALIFPGGFGAALNLSDFALKGNECKVNPEVERLIIEMHKAKKPIGAICIAPAILAKVLGKNKIKLTIGTDRNTAQALESMGAVHIDCKVNEIAVDEENKIVTTPAYMLGKRIIEVSEGIEKLVNKIIELIKK